VEIGRLGPRGGAVVVVVVGNWEWGGGRL
jgi:hypothetical protein